MTSFKFPWPALCLSLGLILAAGAEAVEQSGWNVSQTGTWTLPEHGDYVTGKGSPSRLLRVDEAVPHHKASMVLRPSITTRLTFALSCVLQSPAPALELSVPALDIRMEDGFRGYVFARMRVDEGPEYSLRGEIYPPGRLIFAPMTQAQQERLASLSEALKEGELLTIALLQGRDKEPRLYHIPLTGLAGLLPQVQSDCERLATLAGKGEPAYLPDYLTAEGSDYAPEDYSLVPRDDGLVPREPDPLPPEVTVTPAEPVPPEPIPFSGSGGRASIDASGNVIEAPAAGEGNAAQSGGAAGTEPGDNGQGDASGNGNLSLPVSEGPLQIGPDGMPIF